ncbi:MAG TPA: AAA family ATPase [bacterium]
MAADSSAEERKVVSILFCDLVESTPLAGSRDPEEWRAVVAQYFAQVRAAIEQFGGTVEKFVGDAVMAVFGLPAAHDDDPQRAVRAAHAVLASTRMLPDLRVRIGIATGEVIANPRAAEKGEFLVTGEAVHLAARLQAAADPGAVIIDARTQRNTADIVDARPIGPLDLKGFAQPVDAWAVTAVSADIERPRRALRAPLVGRDEELQLLQTVLQRVVRDRRAAMVTIIGDAGVGKSRLFAEFRAALPAGTVILQGRSLPYGSNVAFSALVDALKRAAGIQDAGPQEEARDRLRQFVQRSLGPAEDFPRLLTHLFAAFGIAEGPAAFPITRGDLFTALTRLLGALASTDPVVVGLEDIHWADEELLDLLDDLTLRPPAAPVLIVCLARPLLLERHPGWGGGRRNVLSIHLDPLPADTSRELIHALLQGPAPQDIIDRVLARAEGNPFFVEEILRMLIDDGRLLRRDGRWQARDTEMRLPDTVQGVIAARLDQLPAEEKQTVQDAAVVGRIFWVEPLRRLQSQHDVRELIKLLEQKDIVLPRTWSTVRGEEEFIFRHILIRDVAYNTLPRSQRAAKHRVVADWLAVAGGDRPDELADLLAYHYEQAQAWEQAFTNVLRLADRAYALDTYRPALAHYRHAADLAGQFAVSAAQRLHVFVQRGWTLARLADYDPALADLTEGRRLAHDQDSGEWEVGALLGIAWVQGHRGDYEANSQTTREALAIARAIGIPRLVVDCLLDLGSVDHNQGRVNEGVEALDEAAVISAQIGYERGTVHAMRGLALQDVGRLGEAIAYHRRAAVRTREIGERRIEAANLVYLAQALIQAGQPREAREHADAARELSVQSGDRYREQYARRSIALASLRLGDFGRAQQEGETALELARSLRDYEVIGYAGGILAELYAQMGVLDLAADREAEARGAIARVTSMMPGKGLSLGNIGTARLILGDLDGARAVFEEAASSLYVLWGPPEGLWGLGVVAARLGKADQALRYAADLEALAAPRAMKGFAARGLWVRALVDPSARPALLQEAIGLAQAAEERPVLRSLFALAGSTTEADAVSAEIAATIPDARLRERFLATAPL